MVIKSVNLETVCGITSKLPENTLPEVAFAGKSNVGKSSLINAIMNRKSYAKTSSQPGKTQTINFYNIDEKLYSVSIPLGATVNMAGAAITIAVLSLAAAHTLGISVDFGTALLLCFVSAIAACGASGIAGGSLMLIPLACSLFGISNDIAMQVVAIGYIIGVIQDSFETALNSSTDVLFTAAVNENLKVNESIKKD